MRDQIVMSRMRAYDIEFDSFSKRLNGDSNLIATGGDLTLLVLAGLIVTTGSVGTATALGAASAGVLGAQNVINRDLYFQRTLPALLAQMEANRSMAKLAILQGLNVEDAKYPLWRAELDLDQLKRAGSVPFSIDSITQKAEAERIATQASIDQLRSVPFNTTSSTARIIAWLFPSGSRDVSGNPLPPDPVAVAALQAWMKTDRDPNIRSVPLFTLVSGSGPGLEEARQRALADRTLNIP